MSWRLLLSEYPVSLLSNERHVRLLALLEWGGALTEDQLQVQLSTDKSEIIADLLSLHRNKCIEYSGQFVKVSDRGKRLIDRMALQSDILDHLLKPIPIPASSRPNIKETLLRFRTHAFDRYLESAFAMHSWTHAVKNAPFKQDLNSEDVGVGLLAILMHDLAHWVHEDTHERFRFASGELFGFETHGVDPDARTRKAVEWLQSATALEKSKDPWSDIREEKELGRWLYKCHHASRSCLETYEWRDEWSAQGRALLVLDACRSGLEARERLSLHGVQRNWFLAGPVSIRQRHRELSHETTSDQTIRQVLDELLWKLLAAKSFADFAEDVGLQEAWLEELLAQIRDKCAELIQDKNTKTSPAQAATAPEPGGS